MKLGFKLGGKHNWPLIIGAAGLGVLGYFFIATRFISPGIHAAAPPSMMRGAPPMRPHRMMMGGGGMHPMMVHAMRNENIRGESGGTIPVGGGPAGVTGGGGDYGYPSGRIGVPGGYGIQGGYMTSAGVARLAMS